MIFDRLKKKKAGPEYMILLPTDWNIKSNESQYYWPIGELKSIARLPIDCESWLGEGHTIHANENMEPVDSSTKLNCFTLFNAIDKQGEKSGFSAFLEKIPDEDLPPIVNPQRRNYCE